MLQKVSKISAMVSFSVGFKEWSLVCSALGAGAQSLILRKGGIHEGKTGFWWRHDEFYLFPTHFHEQDVEFKWRGAETGATSELQTSQHVIQLFAKVEKKIQILDWQIVEHLEGLHFWTRETIRNRFDYSEATGISLAFLRIYRLDPVWIIADEKKFGGCRSWLELPAPSKTSVLTPVLNDGEHTGRLVELEKRLKP